MTLHVHLGKCRSLDKVNHCHIPQADVTAQQHTLGFNLVIALIQEREGMLFKVLREIQQLVALLRLAPHK
eukprot:SAG11_NODE_1424_length_4949_cov_2.978763_3_plen_70_part_00